MPDDTAATLSEMLGCEPWEVVTTVKALALDIDSRIGVLRANAQAQRERADHLERELAMAQSPQVQRVRRIEHAREIAPTAGPFRRAVLAALRRGKEWGDITEADYLRITAQPCHWCDGPLGNGIALDRQDVRRGYFLDNVVPSCGPCNIARHRTEGGRRPGGGKPSPLASLKAREMAPWGERIEPGSLGAK